MNQQYKIAFYMQHYLASSMTFVYRQLLGINQVFPVEVIISGIRENTDMFSYDNLNFIPRAKIWDFQQKVFAKLHSVPFVLWQNINPCLLGNQRREIKQLLIDKEINLIHAQFGPSAIEILPIARELKIPLVVTFHGYDVYTLFNYSIYLENISDLSDYAAFICVSDIMREKMLQTLPNKPEVGVIHCGIPTDDFKYIERKSPLQKKTNNETIIFLQISSFVEKKGHQYTLAAFRKYLSHYPNSRLILAGEGYLKDSIKKQCSELGLKDKVQFPGNIDHRNVPDLMKSADIFVHHSIMAADGNREGIPTVLMEAMASGLPVISTYHSGIPELVDDTINGFLVDEKDIETYSRRMLDMISNELNFGIKAREKVLDEFDLDKQNKKLIEFYEKCLKN